MAVEIYPRAFQNILKFASANKEFRSLFNRLEIALKEKEILKKTKRNLRKQMHYMRVDLRVARRRKAARDLEIRQLKYLSDALNKSYNYLVQFMNLLDEEKIKRMISFGVLRMEQEVQQKIKKIQKQQKAELETKTQMEARFIVQQFRQFQRELMNAEEEHSSVSKEFAQMERNWKEKLDLATEQRNKKIISLVELSKKISERKVSFGHKIDAGKTKAQVLPKKVEPVVLQSAMEFVNKYAEVSKVTRKGTVLDILPDAPLRSILVMNRSMDSSNEMEQTICSNKQVHFAPLPSSAHVSSTEPMVLNDLQVDMGDMSDLNSESSKLEDVTMSDSKYFADRPIIETVEVLPTLSFSTPKAMNPFDQNLTFKNIFQSDDPMPLEDLQNTNNETETMNSNNSNNVSNSEDALNMMDFNFEKDFFNDEDGSQPGNYSYDL